MDNNNNINVRNEKLSLSKDDEVRFHEDSLHDSVLERSEMRLVAEDSPVDQRSSMVE